uniref:plasmid replication protein, CyRepA1 family n=1 Tax=uncultured Nostoc sp. TaxID=340711 RepID=UPI0035CA08A7
MLKNQNIKTPSADLNIANDGINGKSISAIAPLILPDGEGINFDEMPSCQPPQTEIKLSEKVNSSEDNAEAEYIKDLIASGNLNTREQINLFFKAIGYSKQDRTYIRCIPAKNIPDDKLIELGLGYRKKDSEAVIKKTIKGYIEWDDEEEDYIFYENRYNQEPQKHPWGIQRLQELGKKGYGIYFVVGQGGDNDKDIVKVDTLFYECDGISKDEQWKKVEKLRHNNKLNPIAIEETRNSIHVYYRRENNNDFSVDTFKFLQQRLIQLAESDPSIHNEARLMRLPGFDHVKWNDGILEFVPCVLKLCDFNAPHYSDLDFNETLPKWDEKRWGKKKKSNNSLDAHNVKNFSQNIQNNGYYSDANNIKNFAPYLEAGEVRKGDIETYKCPAHNGESNNSLHIFPNGAFKCHGGCDNREVWKAAKDIAVAHGYVLPQKKQQDYQKTKEEYFVDYEAKRKEVARHHFTRQPNILVNEGYFPDIKLKDLPQGLIGIKGDWGTGKSHLIASLIKQYPYNKVVQIGHLNSLLFNTSEKYGLTHHHLAKEQKWGLGGCDRLAITDISVGALLKTEIYSELRYVLVLDEIEQILNSLVNNKNLKGTLRLAYFSKLVWLIRNAEYLIFADADLSDSTLEFLEAIRNAEKLGSEPEKTFIIHHTKKQGKGRKIKISKDKGATLKRLYKSLADGQKVIAPFENKSDLLALQENTLNDDFRKSTDIIHGDNSQEEQVREYIKNIDSLYTESNNLFYTGTLGTGIDLSRPHYDKRFGIFTGDVFAASDQCQQFSRYRPNCDSEIFCDTKKRNFKIDADQLVLELVNKNNESNTYFCDNISQLIEAGFYPRRDGTFDEYDQAFLKLWGTINARSNASRANPYQSLVDRLTEAGYELEFLDDTEDKTENDGVLASQKATKKELKDKEDIAKAEARVLTDDEYIDAIRPKG